MSLDDLLPLLLILAFVVNAVLRGRRGSRGRPGRSGRRGAGRGESTGSGSPAPPADERPATSDGAGGQASAGDDLQRRVEEARRRVRDAGGGSEGRAQAGTSSSSPSSGAPSSAGGSTTSGGATASGPSGGRGGGRGPSTAPQPSARPAASLPSFLGREGVPPAPSSTEAPSGFLGREGPPPGPRVTRPARPAPARREAGEGSATLVAASGLGNDPEDVVRGVMWSVVLGPPVARRARRRTVSPRRSP